MSRKLKSKLYNSGVLFRIAREAYKRTSHAKSDIYPGQKDALVAIIFAASTLEAFINELADLALMSTNNTQKEKLIQQFAEALHELENSNESTRLKFILSKLLISGQAYDKGAMLYQDFDLLFKLRNNIVHFKPIDLTGNPPKFLRAMETRQLLGKFAEDIPKEAVGWISKICTRNTAKWACNVASNMITDLKESIESAPIENKGIQSLLAFASNGYEKI